MIELYDITNKRVNGKTMFGGSYMQVLDYENIEMSVTDHSHPYPDCLYCYCIKILLAEPSYSCQEKMQHDKSRHNTCQQEIKSCRVPNWPNIVHWQPPDGSRLASGFVVGTDVNYFICYNSRG